MADPRYDTPEPFTVDIPERALIDLDERLRRWRPPTAIADNGSWASGTDPAFLAELVDYLLTNRLYRRSPLVEAYGPAHVMDVLWQVQPAFLDAAFEAIDTDFGGLPNYLEGPMGLGPKALENLRERLLEA
jgi:hypothetical protein